MPLLTGIHEIIKENIKGGGGRNMQIADIDFVTNICFAALLLITHEILRV